GPVPCRAGGHARAGRGGRRARPDEPGPCLVAAARGGAADRGARRPSGRRGARRRTSRRAGDGPRRADRSGRRPGLGRHRRRGPAGRRRGAPGGPARGRAARPRTGGAGRDRRGTAQPGDRREAAVERAHREIPRSEHPGETRGVLAGAGRGARAREPGGAGAAASGGVGRVALPNPGIRPSYPSVLGGVMESRAKAAGHAVHPMLVMFPLGLLTTAVVFDVLHLITGGSDFAIASAYMIAAGVVGGLLAAVFGWIDWFAIPGATRAK